MRVSRASVSGTMYSIWHQSGPPVPDDLSVLRHTCTGASCEFCIMRSKNLIELGRWRVS